MWLKRLSGNYTERKLLILLYFCENIRKRGQEVLLRKLPRFDIFPRFALLSRHPSLPHLPFPGREAAPLQGANEEIGNWAHFVLRAPLASRPGPLDATQPQNSCLRPRGHRFMDGILSCLPRFLWSNCFRFELRPPPCYSAATAEKKEELTCSSTQAKAFVEHLTNCS